MINSLKSLKPRSRTLHVHYGAGCQRTQRVVKFFGFFFSPPAGGEKIARANLRIVHMDSSSIISQKVGNLGERIAENYLKKKGYQILDKNYSFRIPGNPKKGEIDIIAQKSDIISFVEVKTLADPAMLISPEEKVNFWKQRKLIKTAESWLMKKKIPLNSKWQIDVISVMINKRKAKVWHFENAIPYQ